MNFKCKYKISLYFFFVPLFLGLILGPFSSDVNLENNNSAHFLESSSDFDMELYYFYIQGCPICIEKETIVDSFNNTHDNINYTKVAINSGYPEQDAFAQGFFSDYLDNPTQIPNPSAVFALDSCRILILKDDITPTVLEDIYQSLMDDPEYCDGWMEYGTFNLWIAFVTGLVSGLSPCVVLMTGVLGTSIFASKDKKTFLLSAVGFILGVMFAYFFIGIAFTYLFEFASTVLTSLTLRLAVGIPLILLGLWYVIDAWNENSRLFKTPERVKIFLKSMAGKGSVVSTFLLGLAFTLIKSPCVAGIMLSLLFNINQYSTGAGSMIISIIIFALGILLPILIVFAFLRVGISSEKINENRQKYRPYIRLVSGLLIIGLTIWSLF